jgi:hypothetical protein
MALVFSRAFALHSLVNCAIGFAFSSGVALAQVPAAQKSAAESATPGNASRPTLVVLRYESAFSNYKPLGDMSIGSWRDANDTVTRIGGWRTYLREAQEPASSPPAQPSTSSSPAAPTPAPAANAKPVAPAADPHAGHRRHQ